MGTSEKSPSQKCADLFINIKSIKNKAKAFTFQCTLCGVACEQLKKFSKHLENHLEYFENQLENASDNHPFLGTEEIKKELEFNGEDESYVGEQKPLLEFEDPLETEKVFKAELAETIPYYNEENVKDLESFSTEISNEIIKVETTEIVDTANFFLINDLNPDESLKNSSGSCFNLEKELNTSKNVEKSTVSTTKKKRNTVKRTKSTEEIDETDDKNSIYCKKTKKTPIVTSILPFLIQQYKKYEILWETDDIAFGIKIKIHEVFAKILEALKLEENQTLSLDDLNYHIRYLNELYTKDRDRELKCQKEKVEFVPKYEYYKEMSFLSKCQGPFLCPICNEIQPRYHVYCRHLAQHNDTQPYKCPLCDSTFIKYHMYLVHKKRHLGIHDFHCEICGKGFMLKTVLEWHVTSHTGVKPYLCQICGASFRARHDYYNHVRRHEERFRHECHICKRGFNHLHALHKHVKSHLDIRDVICNICGKGFTHRQYLLRHVKIHGEEKHYKCNDCGKAFFQPEGLRTHKKRRHS